MSLSDIGPTWNAPWIAPWKDRSRRFSTVRLVGLCVALGPGLWLAWSAWTGGLGGDPLKEAINQTGLWTLRMLLLTLAITPLRRIAAWSRPIVLRRLLGLATAGYGLVHLLLHLTEQAWNLPVVLGEIVMRLYLTIGFLGLAGLFALGATSTDAAIRRMGPRWRRLHRLSYVIAPLGLAHYTLQSKIDITEPAWMTGAFLLLMSWRIADARGFSVRSPLVLGALAAAAAIVTAGLEAAWYGLATGVPPLMVLQANLEFAYRLSPAWMVFAIGAAPALYRLGGTLIPPRWLARAA